MSLFLVPRRRRAQPLRLRLRGQRRGGHPRLLQLVRAGVPAARRAGADPRPQRLRPGPGGRRDRRQPRPRASAAGPRAHDAGLARRRTCATRCETGYSGNLVVHAFARTAIRCGIGEELVDPFFASMRMDLETTVHTPESFDRYVYGSAEVVGLMCLRVFLAGEPERRRGRTTTGSRPARGGSARRSRSSTSCATSPRTTTPLGRSLLPGPRRRPLLRRRPGPASSTTSTPTSPRPPPSCRDLPASSRRAVRVAHATVRRARRPAAGHPGRGDPPHPRPGPRRREAPARRRRAARGRA